MVLNGLEMESDSSFEDSSFCFTEDYQYPAEQCNFCNGYYGPSFNEPVCSTCHIFVYSCDISRIRPPVTQLSDKDDGDSGNDEPNDAVYVHERSVQNPDNAADENIQGQPSDDKLAEQLQLLSQPRDGAESTPPMIQFLPPEVLLVVFSFLDDISLWSVANVCKRWKTLLESFVPDERWQEFTGQRWPLFTPIMAEPNWCKIFSNLIDSSSCLTCLQTMFVKYEPFDDENSWRNNRLQNELRNIRSDPPVGIQVQSLDKRGFHWQATITGPAGSPYEGGLFFVYVQVPCTYPMNPPIVRFITKIFHPNISRHGDIGIDSIAHNWSLVLTISKVLISIQSLLTDPNCDVCMEPEVGRLYVEDKITFENIARAWTWRYAIHDVLL